MTLAFTIVALLALAVLALYFHHTLKALVLRLERSLDVTDKVNRVALDAHVELQRLKDAIESAASTVGRVTVLEDQMAKLLFRLEHFKKTSGFTI